MASYTSRSSNTSRGMNNNPRMGRQSKSMSPPRGNMVQRSVRINTPNRARNSATPFRNVSGTPGMGSTGNNRLVSAGRFSRIAGSRVGGKKRSVSSSNIQNSGKNHLQDRMRMIQQATGVKNGPGMRLKK